MDTLRRHHRYYDLILAAFVVVLLCSNFIGAGKAAVVSLPYFGELAFGAGILFFPISYFFGDILNLVKSLLIALAKLIYYYHYLVKSPILALFLWIN